MSHLNKILGLLFTAFLLIAINPAPAQAQPGVSVSFQTFYDELQPYGTWVDDPDYGDVWVPDVDEDFKPYATNGHWIVTDYGNTWESDYEWGWAPFHYGRWRFDDYYGWEWIPGSEWGPAWVNWRTGGGYYAWAPLGPRVSIDVSFGNDYNVPDDYWVCAPYAYITSPRIYDYYLPRARVVNVIRNTTIINNVYVNNNRRYVSGPRTQDIERYTNHPVDVYRINNVNDPRSRGIQNHTVNMYRPAINRNSGNGADMPRPARVVDASAYRNAHPNEGLGNRGSNGAVVNHSNASKLAQTARDPHPENGNVVRIYRPGSNNGVPNGTNQGTNGGRFNRTGNQPNQPGQGNPGNNNGANHTTSQGNTPTHVGPVNGTIPANGTNGGYNRDRNRPGQNGQPVQGTGAPVNNNQPTQNNPAGQNYNNGKFGHNRDQQNQGGQPAQATPSNAGQPVQAAPVNATPIPNTTTTPANPTGGFNRSRYRPNQSNPNNSTPPANNNPAVTQPQTDQQAQQREQQRQQHIQQMQQQQQAQPHPNNGQQRQQPQPAQQQQQVQQQQQRQQQRVQQQQQKQQQRPKPEHTDEHPPQ